MMRSLSVAALATIVAGDFPHMNPGVDYIVSNPAPGAEVRSRLLSLFSSSPAHSWYLVLKPTAPDRRRARP